MNPGEGPHRLGFDWRALKRYLVCHESYSQPYDMAKAEIGFKASAVSQDINL